MSDSHLIIYFVLCILQMIARLWKEWRKIEFHNEQVAGAYIINKLLAPAFTNIGLIWYGALLLAYIMHPPIFFLFAENLESLYQYLGLLALYMIIKGLFGLVNDNNLVKKNV